MKSRKDLSKTILMVNNSIFAAKAENTLTYIYEKELAAKVGEIFKKMKEEILKNLDEYYSPDIMLNAHKDLILAPIHEYHKEYYETIMKYKNFEHKKGQIQGKRLITRAKEYAKNYSKMQGAIKEDIKAPTMNSVIKKGKLFGTSEYSAAHMEAKTFIASENTLNRVDSDITEILADGYKEGWGINDVGKKVKRRFGQLETWESNRIARTEIHGSHMLGVLDSYDEMGVEYIQWASAHDERTRDTHVRLDGEIIRQGRGTFSNGLRYPGDTDGKLSEFINCRCGAVPWFCPPGYAVPQHMGRFREKDLIATHDEWTSPDDLIAEMNEKMATEPAIPGYNRYALTSEEKIKLAEYQATGYSHLSNIKKHEFKVLQAKSDFNTLHNKKITTSLSSYEQSQYDEIMEKYGEVLKIKVTASTPPKEVINIDELWESTSEYHQGKYLVNVDEDGVLLIDGKAYYKGLEIKEFYTGSASGYISKEEINAHNAALGHVIDKVKPKKEIILIKDLHQKDNNIIISSSDEGFELINGKAYYKGLELDTYNPNLQVGGISKYKVITHNSEVLHSQVDVGEITVGSAPRKEIINLADMKPTVGKPDVYIIKGHDDGFELVDGKAYYKGLHIKKYVPTVKMGSLTKKDIEAHNASILKSKLPAKEPIDTDDLTSSALHDSWLISSEDKGFKVINGKGYYKGMEVPEYNPKIDKGYVYKKDIDAHNTLLLKGNAPVKEHIDVDDLVKSEDGDGWLVDSYDEGFEVIGDKAYYKGLEVKDYIKAYDIGTLTKKEIKLHNASLNPVDKVPTKISDEVSLKTPKKEFIDPTKIEHSKYNPGHYIVDSTDDGFELIGDKGYYKGLELKDYNSIVKAGYISEKDLYAHNASISKNYSRLLTKKEYININDDELFPSAAYDGKYLVGEGDKGYKIINGEGYYKGLKIKDYSEKPNYGYISKKEINNHNAELTAKAPTKPSKVGDGAYEGEYINTSDLWHSIEHKDHYSIDSGDKHIVKNPVTGKYEYKGLELKNFDYAKDNKAFISYGDVEEHNAKVLANMKKPTNPPKKEFINISKDGLSASEAYPNEFPVYVTDDEYTLFNGEGYYKGLKITHYKEKPAVGYISKDEIASHNSRVLGEPLNKYELTPNQKIKLKEYGKYEPHELTHDEITELNIVRRQQTINNLHNKKITEGLSDYETKKLNALKEDLKNNYHVDIEEIAKKPKSKFLDPTDLPVENKKFFDFEKGEYFDSYVVSGSEEGFELIDGKFYYKGVGVHDYAQGKGYIYKHEVLEFNKKQAIGDLEIPSNDDAFEYLSSEEYLEFKNLKADIEWAIRSQTDTALTQSGKDAALHKLDDVPKLKILSNKVNKKLNQGLTWDEIEELDIDPYGDYMIEPHHHVKFNKETEEWEYKGVELFEYDEEDKIGTIDENVMKKYIEDHNLRPKKVYFNNKKLTETEINDEKHVVDEKGHAWVIDTDRKYERHQDSIQNANANKNGIATYSDYEEESVQHWGVYGHQKVGNLIYGDTPYAIRDGWDKYQDFMNDEITPLLNKMKKKYKIINNENISVNIRADAIDDYQKLEKEYAKLVESVGDSEVEKVLWEMKDLDAAIIKTPRLAQDTAFVRYGHFDEDMAVVGEIHELKGYLSTSYDDITREPDATSHFAAKPERWKIIVLAPEGTEGIRLNRYFHALTTEREWLLPRQQKFEVVEVGTTSDVKNPNRRVVTIRLINDE